MEFNFFGFHLQLWKLHTALDYTVFALCLAGGVALLVLATKRMGRRRNDESATLRVGKKLRRLGGRAGVLLPGSVLPKSEGYADAFFISPCGAFAVRCIGWGYRISGSLRARQWRAGDAKEERFISNPFAQASFASEAATTKLAEQGINASVEPLVVFADPFNPSPRFSLEGGANTIGFAELKRWYRAQPDNVLDKDTIAKIAHTFAPEKA